MSINLALSKKRAATRKSFLISYNTALHQQKKNPLPPLPVEEKEVDSWIVLQTEDGYEYRFNPNTGEAKWKEDEDFIMEGQDDDWQVCHTDDGLAYLYNVVTGESEWLVDEELSQQFENTKAPEADSGSFLSVLPPAKPSIKVRKASERPVSTKQPLRPLSDPASVIFDEKSSMWEGLFDLYKTDDGHLTEVRLRKLLANPTVKLNAVDNLQWTATVKHAYKARTAQEIDLQKGQKITIFNKFENEMKLWWEGEIEVDGAKKKGFFPSNYVKMDENSNAPTSRTAAIESIVFDAFPGTQKLSKAEFAKFVSTCKLLH